MWVYLSFSFIFSDIRLISHEFRLVYVATNIIPCAVEKLYCPHVITYAQSGRGGYRCLISRYQEKIEENSVYIGLLVQLYWLYFLCIFREDENLKGYLWYHIFFLSYLNICNNEIFTGINSRKKKFVWYFSKLFKPRQRVVKTFSVNYLGQFG